MNILKAFESEKISKRGMYGYDNAREVIDPHIKTKVINAKEISSGILAISAGIVYHTPTLAFHIANKKYVDDNAGSGSGEGDVWRRTISGANVFPKTTTDEISGANLRTSGKISGGSIYATGTISAARLVSQGIISGVNIFAAQGISASNIYTTGSVGIGTTAPTSLLEISDTNTGNIVDMLELRNKGNNENGTGEAIIFGTETFNQARIWHVKSPNTNQLHLAADGFTTPVITIENNNVGIGDTTPSFQLELSTDSAGKPGTGGTWTVVSDERIKKDIQLADLNRCYEIVKQVPLKRFTWKEEAYTNEQIIDRSNIGWISQDVQAVFPKSTQPKKFKMINGVIIEDCLTLNSGQMIIAMYGAIQKLMEKIESLEAA